MIVLYTVKIERTRKSSKIWSTDSFCFTTMTVWGQQLTIRIADDPRAARVPSFIWYIFYKRNKNELIFWRKLMARYLSRCYIPALTVRFLPSGLGVFSCVFFFILFIPRRNLRPGPRDVTVLTTITINSPTGSGWHNYCIAFSSALYI